MYGQIALNGKNMPCTCAWDMPCREDGKKATVLFNPSLFLGVEK